MDEYLPMDYLDNISYGYKLVPLMSDVYMQKDQAEDLH